MWQAVSPTPGEILAATNAFNVPSSDHSAVVDFLPQLVMVRRAFAAGFFNEGLSPGAAAATPATLESLESEFDRN